jgi:hypothetical protein
MPRRASSEDVVIRLPGQGRPAAPPKLSTAEQEVWRALVDSSPDGWLDPAGQLILKCVVCQVTVAERLERRLLEIAEAGGQLELELVVAKAHREAMRGIMGAMTALRLTPRSRTRPSNAATAFDGAPTGRRPWDAEPSA